MYEQNKREYAKYEPNVGYPPAYAPVQVHPYAGYRPRRNRFILTLLLLAALIVVGLSIATIGGITRHFNAEGTVTLAQAMPLGGKISPPALPDGPSLFLGKDGTQLAKPNAPLAKGCNSGDAQCSALPQTGSAPALLPNGQDCSPCIWTTSPSYQPDDGSGNHSGDYHIYDMESLNPGVDAAVKQDLANGWTMNISVGPHARALVFTDLNMVCEASDQCHAIGKLAADQRHLLTCATLNPLRLAGHLPIVVGRHIHAHARE
jgi:hypothetical protein